MSGRQRFCGFGVGAAALLITVLAGCSGDSDGAATLPPITTTPATTSHPTGTSTATGEPTPTTTLTLFDEHDASVDAFVQEFFAAYNAAQDSRDLSAFEALYLPQCSGCIAMRDELAAWLAGGQTIQGGDWHVYQQTSSAFPDGSKGAFDVLAYRDAATVLDEAGQDVTAVQPTQVVWYQSTVVQGKPWVIEDLGEALL